MNDGLVQTLSLALIFTSLATVEMRKLFSATVAYVVQALLIVCLLLSFAMSNPALYWWAGTAFLTKVVLTPIFFFWAIYKTENREFKPLIGFGPSVGIAIVLMIGFYRFIHQHAELLTTSKLAEQAVFQTNLAVAATVFVLGLYCVLTRRDAIKTVLGLCLLENGVHLSLVSLAPNLPETALFGIATEVVVTVFLLLYVIVGVRDKFGTTDTYQLKELRG
ncbi:MAG: NADH-quinone oxidoreductase subunit K [Pseudomonadota bacterium]